MEQKKKLFKFMIAKVVIKNYNNEDKIIGSHVDTIYMKAGGPHIVKKNNISTEFFKNSK